MHCARRCECSGVQLPSAVRLKITQFLDETGPRYSRHHRLLLRAAKRVFHLNALESIRERVSQRRIVRRQSMHQRFDNSHKHLALRLERLNALGNVAKRNRCWVCHCRYLRVCDHRA